MTTAFLFMIQSLSSNAFAATVNESESNNTLSTANTMSLSATMTGTISSENDIDWYKFTTNSSGVYRIGLSSIPEDVDYELALYGPSSNELAKSISINKYESICMSLNASTVYYIKVYSFRGYSSTKKYQLRISTTEQSKENWSYCFRGSKMATKITTNYQPYSSTYPHYGIDIVHDTDGEIANDYPLYSVKSGTVLYASTQMSNSAGWYVAIDIDSAYGNTETVRYLHLKESPLVSTGDSVTQNTVLGYVGNTGTVYPAPSTSNPNAGAHLHFDVNTVHAIYGGSSSSNVNASTAVDPKPYFESIVNFT